MGDIELQIINPMQNLLFTEEEIYQKQLDDKLQSWLNEMRACESKEELSAWNENVNQAIIHLEFLANYLKGSLKIIELAVCERFKQKKEELYLQLRPALHNTTIIKKRAGWPAVGLFLGAVGIAVLTGIRILVPAAELVVNIAAITYASIDMADRTKSWIRDEKEARERKKQDARVTLGISTIGLAVGILSIVALTIAFPPAGLAVIAAVAVVTVLADVYLRVKAYRETQKRQQEIPNKYIHKLKELTTIPHQQIAKQLKEDKQEKKENSYQQEKLTEHFLDNFTHGLQHESKVKQTLAHQLKNNKDFTREHGDTDEETNSEDSENNTIEIEEPSVSVY